MATGKKPSPRTTQEKLRGLVNLKIKGTTRSVAFYTQKELSVMLGIGERTIRRFKNQKGYSLAPETLKRIRKNVDREDKRVKRILDQGTAIRAETKTIRGVKYRHFVQVVGEQFKLPITRILQLPVIYPSQSGASQTFMVNVEGWLTEEKFDLVRSAHESKRFSSWHAKVDLRQYLIQKLIVEYGDLESVPADVMADTLSPHYIMIGPFEMGRINANLRSAREKILYYEDAGRVIVEIHLVEKLRPAGMSVRASRSLKHKEKK